MNGATKSRAPWFWIPTLYYGQGIPYVVVMSLSVVLYKNLGLSNTDIALYTSWLYLPWVIKPLWSPLVDMFRTKRFWIFTLQMVIGASLALVALTIPTTNFFQLTLAVFWLMAFSSATHDIAADGFYMLALEQHQQAAFVGVRSAFYRAAMLSGQGLLVWLAGKLGELTGNVSFAWTIVFFVLAGLFVFMSVYHFFILPKPLLDVTKPRTTDYLSEFFETFVTFFNRKNILLVMAFLLLFRFGEAQGLKLVQPFLLDPPSKGGLGLSTADVGIAYGVFGIASLTIGGLLGGYVISRFGLKRCLWPMLLITHIPNVLLVLLAFTQPTNFYVISAAIAIEQLGYGFGFTSYMLFMILVADGWGTPQQGNNSQKTAHYAICTGFMALGMMLPGMVSGRIQEYLGYPNFFIWVCIACVPSLIVAAFIKIDPSFGKKKEVAE